MRIKSQQAQIKAISRELCNLSAQVGARQSREIEKTLMKLNGGSLQRGKPAEKKTELQRYELYDKKAVGQPLHG